MKTRGKQYRDLAPKKPPKKQPKSVVVDHVDAVWKDTLDAQQHPDIIPDDARNTNVAQTAQDKEIVSGNSSPAKETNVNLQLDEEDTAVDGNASKAAAKSNVRPSAKRIILAMMHTKRRLR